MGAMTPGREYMSPRGFVGEPRLGKRAFMGTLELRAPIIPISFAEFFKIIKLGSPTFALISDFGNAWNNQIDNQEMILTTGYEFRTSLMITNVPLIILSYGFAQEHAMWSDGIIPDSYFKLTLINPF